MSDTLLKELKENPKLKDTIRKKDIPFLKRNPAQLIDVLEYTNRYGKEVNEIKPNTYIADLISKLPNNNFGSVKDYNINTIPKGRYHIKGTEITQLTDNNKQYKNKSIINRRFLSKLLDEYCYINNIPYRRYKKKSKNTVNGIDLYCKKEIINGKQYNLLSGIEGEQLIYELLYNIHHNNIKCFYEYRAEINNPEQANEVVVLREFYIKGKIKEQLLVNEYWYSWKFPRYTEEYLYSLLDEINSGKYYKDIYIPVIEDLFKYPLKNTDIRCKPLTDKQFMKAKNEYEQAIFDNYQYAE